MSSVGPTEYTHLTTNVSVGDFEDAVISKYTYTRTTYVNPSCMSIKFKACKTIIHGWQVITFVSW